MMHVLLIGMNHLTSPLELRERLSLSCGGQYAPLGDLKDLPAVQEAVYLATCNRVEILASTDDPPGARGGDSGPLCPSKRRPGPGGPLPLPVHPE